MPSPIPTSIPSVFLACVHTSPTRRIAVYGPVRTVMSQGQRVTAYLCQLIAGKGATLYLIDREHMGNYDPAGDRHAVQTIPLHDSAFGAVAYWNHHVYQLVSKDWLRDYEVRNGRLSLRATAGGNWFIDPGSTPTVSANGNRDGIVWVIESKGWRSPDRPFVLHAYDAANIAHELYNSEQNPARDRGGLTLRFNIPLVANGKVYVGAKKQVDVYGLLTPSR